MKEFEPIDLWGDLFVACENSKLFARTRSALVMATVVDHHVLLVDNRFWVLSLEVLTGRSIHIIHVY